tara:strand:- start:1501 stop:1797 length:297 start_codon:yes stop_codon:yes gene_type:complete
MVLIFKSFSEILFIDKSNSTRLFLFRENSKFELIFSRVKLATLFIFKGNVKVLLLKYITGPGKFEDEYSLSPANAIVENGSLLNITTSYNTYTKYLAT